MKTIAALSAFTLSHGRLAGGPVLEGTLVVVWSSAWIAGKIGLHSAGPLTLLAIRFGVAGLLMLPIALLAGARWPRRAADYGHLALAGLLVQAGPLAGVYLGLSHGVSAGTSALVLGATPLFTALGAGALLDEKVEPRQWSGMLIGMVGVALGVFNKMQSASGAWEGYAFTFASLAAFVLGTLYQKRFLGEIDLGSGNFIQFVVATAAVLPLALLLEGLHVEWNPALVASALWMALANSIGGVGLLYFLLRHGKANQVSTLFLLVPPVTAVLGLIAFHEVLAPLSVVGFALAAGGVYLGSKRS